jgi:hypothetical protein
MNMDEGSLEVEIHDKSADRFSQNSSTADAVSACRTEISQLFPSPGPSMLPLPHC